MNRNSASAITTLLRKNDLGEQHFHFEGGSVASFREIVSSNFFPPSPSAVVQGAVNPLAYWRSANWGKGRGSKLWNGKRKENDGGSAVRTNKRNWKEREKKRERRERGTEFERTGWDRDDRKRGWPRLPWRPSELKWTHTLSRYACLEGGGRCHLYYHRHPRLTVLSAGRPRLSSRPKEKPTELC